MVITVLIIICEIMSLKALPTIPPSRLLSFVAVALLSDLRLSPCCLHHHLARAQLTFMLMRCQSVLTCQ